jgi:hypothetical protein
MQVTNLLDLPGTGKDNPMELIIQTKNTSGGRDDLQIQKRQERALDQQGVEKNLQDDQFQQ